MSKKNKEKIDESNTKNEQKEEVNIDKEKLDKIEKEIKSNKSNKKEKTSIKAKTIYKQILTNVIIAMLIIIYFVLLILGVNKISAIEYIIDLKTFAIINLIVTLFLFEVAFKKDDFTFAMYAVEMGVLGGITMWMLDIYVRQIEKLNLFIAGFIIFCVIYYMIKVVVIRIRYNKKRVDLS